MRIGVIIPAFNMAPWVGGAIRSILSQTAQNWLMVIVDDGSNDATAEIAATFTDHRIRLVRQVHAGVSVARNRGLAEVDADAILFLDADDWLASDALALLANRLERAPSAVAAMSGYGRISADGACRHFNAPASGDLLNRLLVGNLFANGGHLLIRRQAIRITGEFNTTLSYGEDWDYWVRLALAGEFVAVSPAKTLLFVRERLGSACTTMALDAARYTASMNVVFGNPAVAARVGGPPLAKLRSRAEAEMAWVIGRELIRHRRFAGGLAWLFRSVRSAPSAKRAALLALSWTGRGPFRPYGTRHATPSRSVACGGHHKA